MPPTDANARPRAGWANWLGAVAGLLVLALAIFALRQIAQEVTLAQVVSAVRATSTATLGLSALFAAISYVLLTGYDWLAVRHLGYKVGYGLIALASFTSYTMSHTLGLTVLTGGSVRYRMYTRVGVLPLDVAAIIVICGFTFWLGIVMLAGIGLTLAPDLAGPFRDFAPGYERWAGVLLLAGALAYTLLATFWRRPMRILGHNLFLPDGRATLLQIVLGVFDLGFAAAALWVLLPEAGQPSLVAFVVVYAVAMIVGALSHSPGGLGVFEAVVVVMLPDMPKAELLAALFLFRVIYTLIPFFLGVVLIALSELVAWRQRLKLRAAEPPPSPATATPAPASSPTPPGPPDQQPLPRSA